MPGRDRDGGDEAKAADDLDVEQTLRVLDARLLCAVIERTLEKDTDSGEVTLAKGQNVLVFKVINEKNNWQGCARFTKDGAGVKSITISLSPQ